MTETHAQDELIAHEWQTLIELDDRTSPVEYPDMALITHDELAAIIKRAALQADPEYLAGWKLVPAEITLEMQKAYFDVIDKNLLRVEKDARFGRFDSNREAYQAMLAAAPPPEYLSGQEAVLRDLDYLIDDVVADAYVRGAESLSTEVSPQSARTLHDAIAKALGATPDLKTGKAEVTDAMASLLEAIKKQEGHVRLHYDAEEIAHQDLDVWSCADTLRAALNPGAPK